MIENLSFFDFNDRFCFILFFGMLDRCGVRIFDFGVRVDRFFFYLDLVIEFF